MRLSEAIRLGSALGPQCFEVAHKDGASCAMGAAEIALGIRTSWWMDWPELIRRELEELIICPVCNVSNTLTIITHLNDYHRWTRAQIADWVELHELDSEPIAGMHTLERAVS